MPAAGERVVPAEERLQHARDLAWRALNRRERTVGELAGLLAGKRVGPEEIERVVGELVEQGYLDDARYARQFADERRRLDGWGAERIARRLTSLRVAREHIDAALAEQDRAGELGAALELLRRRFPEPPASLRERDRALAMLLRKGYAAELAYDALRLHAGVQEQPF
jgi:regulatory protein